MEVLVRILERCSLHPDFRFFWRCRPTSLSHLFFIDECFSFLRRTPTFCDAPQGRTPNLLFLEWLVAKFKKERGVPIWRLAFPKG